MARHFGTDHHEVLVDEQAMREFVPELVYHQDEPLSDWTAVPQHFVTRLARETGTIVVQVGEGADELFHGYRGYVDHRRVVVPFQRWVPAAHPAADGRRGGARDGSRRAGRSPRRGALRRGPQPRPVLGRRAVLPGPAQGPTLASRRHHDALRTVERIWDEGEPRAGTPTSSSA